MKSRTSAREHGVGCVLIAGGVTIVGGLIATYMFLAGGVFRGTYTRDAQDGDRIVDVGVGNLIPLGLTVVAIGVLMVIGALVYGGWHVRSAHRGEVRRIDHFRVLARYACDSRGNLLSEWEIEETDKPRFYIRGVEPTGVVDEFEAPPEVYFACGEGMSGEAHAQGRWLGRFIPYIGS
jgi:hypothetical protein